MLGKCLIVDSGPVVEALQISDAVELHKVMVALVVHGQQDQVVIMVSCVLEGTALRVDVELTPRDGLDSGLLAGVVEVKDTEHVAVVGYC